MTKKDKVYKFLNPRGIQNQADALPLEPRLNALNGKDIYFSICDDADIDLPLEKRLIREYRNIKWNKKRIYPPNPAPLSDEPVSEEDDRIQGEAW